MAVGLRVQMFPVTYPLIVVNPASSKFYFKLKVDANGGIFV